MIEFTSSDEEDAARAIRELADRLENFLYYSDGDGISSRSRNILEAAYKPLLRATRNYFPDALCYEGAQRGTPFKKSEGKK